VIPIPQHPRRLRERGFNPACILARALARQHGMKLEPRQLVRLRDTVSQTRLGRDARRQNMEDAFALRRATVPDVVYLVYDVVTTGATLEEAARVLRAGGARRVMALCAARARVRGLSAREPQRSRSEDARDRRAS
jgi:predicted amidophosphoribosyltransferase